MKNAQIVQKVAFKWKAKNLTNMRARLWQISFCGFIKTSKANIFYICNMILVFQKGFFSLQRQLDHYLYIHLMLGTWGRGYYKRPCVDGLWMIDLQSSAESERLAGACCMQRSDSPVNLVNKADGKFTASSLYKHIYLLHSILSKRIKTVGNIRQVMLYTPRKC